MGKSTTSLHEIVFRVYLLFLEIGKNTIYLQITLKQLFLTIVSNKTFRLSKKEAPTASLKRRKWGLVAPIQIKIKQKIFKIGYCALWVLNSSLYINCIGPGKGGAGGDGPPPPKCYPR